MEPITIGLGVFVFSVSSYITVWLSQVTNTNNRIPTNDDIINESLASTNDTMTPEDNYSVITLGEEANID